MKKEKLEADVFDLTKQALQDLGQINYTLALMNSSKIFPSRRVSNAVKEFWDNRKKFYKKIACYEENTTEEENGKR